VVYCFTLRLRPDLDDPYTYTARKEGSVGTIHASSARVESKLRVLKVLCEQKPETLSEVYLQYCLDRGFDAHVLVKHFQQTLGKREDQRAKALNAELQSTHEDVQESTQHEVLPEEAERKEEEIRAEARKQKEEDLQEAPRHDEVLRGKPKRKDGCAVENSALKMSQNRAPIACDISPQKVLVVPYHSFRDGFTAALFLALKQFQFCEINRCVPLVLWEEQEVLYVDGACPNLWTCLFEQVCPALDAEKYRDQHPCEKNKRPPEVDSGGHDPTPAEEEASEHAFQVYHKAAAAACEDFVHSTREATLCFGSTFEGGIEVAFEPSRYPQPCDTNGVELVRGVEVQTTSDCAWTSGMASAIWTDRQQAALLVKRYATPRANILALVDDFVAHNFRPRMVCAHIRGSDSLDPADGRKNGTSWAGSNSHIPSRFLAEVERAIRFLGGGLSVKSEDAVGVGVFVASEDKLFRADIKKTWPMHVAMRDIDTTGGVFDLLGEDRWTPNPKKLGTNEGHLLAQDCLVDILLLSRCDVLLHSLSGVSEAAIMFNPKLHRRSIDLIRDVPSQWEWVEAGGGGMR
jgi:hypothetical protein